MRFTLSIFLALVAVLAISVQAAPAQGPAPAIAATLPLAKKSLGKQRIAAAQFKPQKRAELDERTFIDLPNINWHHGQPQKPQPSQAVCKALPFLPCTDCCPPGYTCRTLLDWDKRDLTKVDKRTFFEKRCYLNISKGSQHWKRKDGIEEEPEQVY